MPILRPSDRMTQRTPGDMCSRRAALRAGRTAAHPAFSLIELVVVILIVSVLTAIAVPRFADSAARSRVMSAADRLGAEIMLTRDRARAASSPRTLTVTRGSGMLRLLDAEETVLGTSDLALEPYIATVVRTDLPASRVQFNGYALPTASGRVMVRSAGYLAIVSIASDGTVGISAATPARAADPAMADVVTQLGAGLTVRELSATPGNRISASSPGDGAEEGVKDDNK